MKKVVLALVLIFSTSLIFAKPVTKDYASKIAYNYYKQYESSRSSDFSISNSFEIKYDGITTMYVFNFNPSGFVIVAADDASLPILGESETGEIKENNENPNLIWWLSSYSREINYIANNNISNKQTVKEWNNIANEVYPASKGTRDVSPLLESITWNQNPYYNDSCPSGTPAGCVAISMGQIMKKWAYPTQGVGYHEYNHPTYGRQHASFGTTTYNWGSMPNSISSHNTPIAQLVYHAGVSVDMNYATGGSGASTYSISNALINYFHYQPSVEYKYKGDYTDSQWLTILQNELDAGRPVNYSGVNSNNQEGHSFVCDGYTTNPSLKFHFNWGWGGSANANFAIGALNPSTWNFNYGNNIIIRIQPLSNAPIANFTQSTTTPAVSASVNFTDASANTPTNWTWTFEGGSPATSNTQSPTGVTFATIGKKLVSLKVSNATGSDIKYQLINVGGTPSAWIKQNTGFSTVNRGIHDICVINPYVVWATCYDGSGGGAQVREFTKTVDGGNTWTPGTITFTNSTNYLTTANIWGINDTIAYACLPPSATYGGAIVKTTNGGTSWAVQSTADFLTPSSWSDFVTFFDAAGYNGLCVGDANSSNQFVFFTTTNGGTNWTRVSNANIPAAQSGEVATTNLYDTFGNTIWFGTNKGRVYKSTDKGYHWSVSTTLHTNLGQTDVRFKDNNIGFAINYYGSNNSTSSPNAFTMQKTTDGGAHWADFTPTGAFTKKYIDFVPGTSNMWVSVGNDSIHGMHLGSSYSNNDCSSFIDIDTGATVQYNYVRMYDINTGWAGSFNASPTDGGIFKWDYSFFTKINEQNKNKEISVNIYPNPSIGIYNVYFNNLTNEKPVVEIYDMLGKLVFNKIIDLSASRTFQVDISNEQSGLYFVKISTNTETITKKVSLMK
ncbi:MAG: C10 family peptidase [Bacteroidales bacterium]|jgi:PKD repeat protein